LELEDLRRETGCNGKLLYANNVEIDAYHMLGKFD
jgi:hypothetical protein